jgi:hypothetical protein
MRIRMRTLMAGPEGVVHADQIIDVPAARAYDLIETGHATQVDDEAPRRAPETATLKGRATRATKTP